MKSIIPATGFLLVAGLFFSCNEQNKDDGPAVKKPVCVSDSMARIIRIDSASVAHIDDELKLAGEISFNDNKVVKVFAFSSGQVTSVKVSIGDHVVKGQVLAVIRSAEVAGNYSDLSESANDVSIAKKQLDNTESLYKAGLASEKDFSAAKETYDKAVTASEKVKKAIAINGSGHTSANGTYIVTAPMSGYVVEKKINEGGFIRNDNGDNLFTIGDISDVWVWANVYESDIAKVKEGYAAKVTTLAYPDSIFRGVVDKVSQILDPVTKVMKIRVRLPNPGQKLKPEMFANIIIENKEGNKAVTIPSEGVLSDNGRHFVIVYHDTCRLELREITVLKTVANRDYVSAGLQPGEKLVSQNQILFFNALKE